MKLSMPIQVGDKTLLDVDASIDNERTMDVIKANGVKKVDVKKTYLKELTESYPEFYSYQNDKLNKAKERGTESRSRAAESIVKARRIQSKAPMISILAKPSDIPDLEKVLIPYFLIEMSSSRWRDINEKVNRSKVVVIWIDGFTDEEQATIRSEAKKNHPDLRILAVYRQFYSGKLDSVKWINNGLHVFDVCFVTALPEKVSEFGLENLSGCNLASLKQPFIQILSDGNFEEEIETWLEEHPNLAISCESVEDAKCNSESRFAIVRVKNEKAQLPELFDQLRMRGFSMNKLVVIPDTISKEEIEGIKTFGRVFVMLGGIGNSKLTALVEKIKA